MGMFTFVKKFQCKRDF